MPSYLLDMCPRGHICTTTYVSSYYHICILLPRYLGPCCHRRRCPLTLHTAICVLILLCMCPHAIYVASYHYICILLPQVWTSIGPVHASRRSTICVSSYYYICILLPQVWQDPLPAPDPSTLIGALQIRELKRAVMQQVSRHT